MPELFDEVDRQDRPTGRKTTKAEAHEHNLLHRCIAIFVTDDAGRLYVQWHKKSDLWDVTVGGHVTAGEDYLTAALREMDEEIGLRGVRLTELATSFFSPEYNMQHMFGIYEVQAPAHWRFTPNDEVERLQLMSVVDVVAQMHKNPREFTPGFINTMRCYLTAKQLPHRLTVSGEHWK